MHVSWEGQPQEREQLCRTHTDTYSTYVLRTFGMMALIATVRHKSRFHCHLRNVLYCTYGMYEYSERNTPYRPYG